MAFLLSGGAARRVQAESIQFPPDSGVVDVTRSPYFAKGDGRTDDTEAIQQAMYDHPNQNAIIYLPNGTYRLSAPLRWPGGTNEETRQRATILQGQSRTGTVVRLMDYAPGFGAGGRGQAMIWMGGDPAMRVRNALRNLTVHTGIGNPGASGVAVNANHQGGVRDVTIISGDKGDGPVGLDLTHAETIGPLLIQNVRVEGFDYGLRTAYSVNSCTIEHLELVKQGTAGIRNSGQTLNLRDLRSTNAVPALVNSDTVGAVTLVDAVLHGLPSRRPYSAIVNRGFLFARSVSTSGITNVIESRVAAVTNIPGPLITEFHSHPRLAMFPALPTSLNLPVEETPKVPDDPLSAWAGPQTHGGVAGDGQDDSSAIQQAIDSGATTVYLPRGNWQVNQTIELRGAVRRIVGCEALLINGSLGSRPIFKVVDGDSPVVVIERLEVQNPLGPLVENNSGRKLVLSSCHNAGALLTGKGPLFLEDVSSLQPWKIRGQSVWARQWDVEVEGPKIVNEGGTLWIFGLKTEKPGTVISTLAQGRTELLGALVVANGGIKEAPLFSLQDASGSFTASEVAFQGNPFATIVRETRAADVRKLDRNKTGPELGLPVRSGGVGLVLYAGHDGPESVPPPKPRRRNDDATRPPPR
jgi:hypothetical protein